MNVSVVVGWCHRSCGLTGFLHLKGLTGTFLDTKRAVCVLGSGVVLQLKRCGVVHKRLGALGHAGPAVIEIGARLRKKKAHDPGQPRMASRPPDAISVAFWTVQLSLISLTPNGRKIGPLIQSNDVNCKCFPINLLSVLWWHRLWRQ